jgi:hypothetical protein
VTVTVLSGHGRYEDPWHDLAGTSHRVALLLAALGLAVEVRGLPKEALTHLDQTDLLVVNCAGNHLDPSFDGNDDAWADARAGLAAYLARGGPILALHGAGSAFADNPTWHGLIGPEWVDGVSFHPPIDLAQIEVRQAAHPIADGLSDFTVWDERYSNLKLHRAVEPYLVHTLDGVVQPLAWAHTEGASRIVYDALGHGLESYDSPMRARLLQREAQWCLGLPLTA